MGFGAHGVDYECWPRRHISHYDIIVIVVDYECWPRRHISHYDIMVIVVDYECWPRRASYDTSPFLHYAITN